jgi:ceroid-lipofuscinosis neuronal protein 5
MEWYELFQLLNCTFPHVIADEKSKDDIVWCNQGTPPPKPPPSPPHPPKKGAACFSPGIDDRHWYENGTMVRVANITGAMFNDLAAWVRWDNDTGVIYETWDVMSKWSDDPAARQFLVESYDCASFVRRVWDALARAGATFDVGVDLRYDFIVIYGDEMERVDAAAHHDELVRFYANFQVTPPPPF